jgi:hypothetical protein
METAQISRWKIQCDSDATREAFSRVAIGSPERCACADCVNFAAARSRAYPSEVLSVFDQLGIDSRKESEIWHTHRDANGLHHYGGFFHFIGVIESGRDAKQKTNRHVTFDFECIGEHFEWGLTSNVALVPRTFANASVTQLEFATQIPWVIDTLESD